MLSGVEDLVPWLDPDGDDWIRRAALRHEDSVDYLVLTYRPRIEGAFARIERWISLADGQNHWRTLTGENLLRIYGLSASARVTDPDDPGRVFEWLLEETRHELGHIVRYIWAQEDRANVLNTQVEALRSCPGHGCAYAYLKRVDYGNGTPFVAGDFAFSLVFDYGGHDEALPGLSPSTSWLVRSDVTSNFRAGFDRRCYGLCRRVLMFHSFAGELNTLGPDAVQLWRSEAGNSLGPEQVIHGLPGVEHPNTITVTDLLGDRTACLG